MIYEINNNVLKKRKGEGKPKNIFANQIQTINEPKRRGRKSNTNINNIAEIENIEIITNSIKIQKAIYNEDNEFNSCIKNKSNSCLLCANYETKILELNDKINKLKNGLLECSISFDKNIYVSDVKFYDKDCNEWPKKQI